MIDRNYILDNVERAVSEGWIRPYYQPVVRTVSGYLCGVEGLARWIDPEYGFLSPGDFIPLLEENRKIHLLDICMIERICQDLVRTAENGFLMIPVSFNLSRIDFELCDIFTIVDETVKRYEVPKNMIRIELTESMAMDDPELILDNVRKFHEAGYQVWMDDFGSAYSSLNVLKDYDFDELKIDMVFLSSFSERSKKIITFVVDMAKEIEIQTLAEGVETLEQFEFLREIGCEKAQGYYFGKPQPYDEIIGRIERGEFKGETVSWRKYYDDVGRVNLNTDDSVALFEYDGASFRPVFMNKRFRREFERLDISGKEETDYAMNESKHSRALHDIANLAIETGKRQRINFTARGTYMSITVEKAASYRNYTMLKAELVNLSQDGAMKRLQRMNHTVHDLQYMYEDIWIHHVKDDYIESVLTETETISKGDEMGRHMGRKEIMRSYALKCIDPADRPRYKEYNDFDTLVERLENSEDHMIQAVFRTRSLAKKGPYEWCLHSFYLTGSKEDPLIIACVQKLAFDKSGVYGRYFAEGLRNGLMSLEDETGISGRTSDLRENYFPELSGVSGDVIWKNVARSSDICFFWKDVNRRFLGASRSFMDYYGLEGMKDLVGKTDEDMGWHVAEEPYKDDELDVIQNGTVVYNVPGKCIVKGVVHDILASKMPLYENGEITGLVGYFIDVEMISKRLTQSANVYFRDTVTGLLSVQGLVSQSMPYVEEYRRNEQQFFVMWIALNDFVSFHREFGQETADHLLRTAGEAITNAVGKNSAVGRIKDESFLVISQYREENHQTPGEMSASVRKEMEKIRRVDGHEITVYYTEGIALSSETDSFQEMVELSCVRAGIKI